MTERGENRCGVGSTAMAIMGEEVTNNSNRHHRPVHELMKEDGVSEHCPGPQEDAGGGGKLGSVYCKCGEGWTCVITKTVGPDAGKPFIKCTGNCSCSVEGEVVKQEESKEMGDGAYCKCGEGWNCEISRSEAEAPKGFECSGPCTCVHNPK